MFRLRNVPARGVPMPNLETLPFDIVILALRIAFIGLLYFFLWQVMRVITRELRQAGPSEPALPKSKYGRLTVVDPGQSRLALNTTFTLQAVTSMGRKPANSIVLEDDFVSGEHALLTWRDGRPWLEDAGSTNGTYLNDSEVTRAVAVSEGDILGIGGVRLKWTEN